MAHRGMDHRSSKLLLRLLKAAVEGGPKGDGHLGAFTPRHLCAVLSSLAWMERMVGSAMELAAGPRSNNAAIIAEACTATSSSQHFPVSSSANQWISVVSRLIMRCAERIPEASVDDATRMVWATARLLPRLSSGSSGDEDSHEGEDLDKGETDGRVMEVVRLAANRLLDSFCGAALDGVWGGSASSSLSLQFPPRLLPSFLWSISQWPPDFLLVSQGGGQMGCSSSSNSSALLSLLLSEGLSAADHPQPPRIWERSTAAGSTGRSCDPGLGPTAAPVRPVLLRSEVLASIDLEGLVTVLYSVGRLCRTREPLGDSLTSLDSATLMAERRLAAGPASPSGSGNVIKVHPELLDSLCSEILSRVSSSSSFRPPRPASSSSSSSRVSGPQLLSCQAVANIAWALSCLGFSHAPLLRHVIARAGHLFGQESESESETAAASLGETSQPNPEDKSRVSCNHTEHGSVTGRFIFKPQEVANLLSSVARLQVQSSGGRKGEGLMTDSGCRSLLMGTVHWVLQWKKQRRGAVSARDASEILYALATLSKHGTAELHLSPRSVDFAELSSSASSSLSSCPSWGEAIDFLADAVATSMTLARSISDGLDLPIEAGDGALPNMLSEAASQRQSPGAVLSLPPPEMLVGAVWALARVGRPFSGGILLEVVSSLVWETRVQVLPLASLGPEDVARLSWALAAASASEVQSDFGLPHHIIIEPAKGDILAGISKAMHVLEAEAVEWSTSLDDQVGIVPAGPFLTNQYCKRRLHLIYYCRGWSWSSGPLHP